MSVIALAERNVPRYTSYPTAPHFTADVGPSVYAAWLAAVPADAALSLYIHVPYCTEICRYCGCHTKATLRPEPLDAYVEALIGEIGLVAAATAARGVVHLHWGGGTPSILGPERLARIVQRIAQHFDLSRIAEHAIELDPRQVTRPLADALAALGVTRASLGVQEFSPHVQEAIGRIQPFETVRAAADALRGAGIARINVDLMYGLPGQSIADVQATVDLVAALHPSRLALFGYAHVPWFKANQKLIDEAALPGASERIDQARAAAQRLASHGYVPVGLDHFAQADDALAVATRAGRLRRNFQGYTTDPADALIGFGASAIGRLPQGFVQNAVDIAGYARAITQGAFATVKGIAVSADDELRGAIIERLMCDLAVDLAALPVPATQAAPTFVHERAELDALAAAGLITIEGSRIAVTEEGRPFVRLVAAAFDAYLAQSRSRHSIAV
ncbi:MAG: oxygen-independent coproporphyrinogen III oxidase [Xanthobacteraceae bacterium]